MLLNSSKISKKFPKNKCKKIQVPSSITKVKTLKWQSLKKPSQKTKKAQSTTREQIIPRAQIRNKQTFLNFRLLMKEAQAYIKWAMLVRKWKRKKKMKMRKSNINRR